MTIFVSLPSRPPSPVIFSPPVRARSVSSRSTCSSAADSSAPARSRSSATSVIWCLLRLGSYTVEITVPNPDNLKTGVDKPDRYDPKLNRGYAELAGHYGVLVDPARAYHPRDKATIEAHQRYIRSSFFAGRSWGSLAAMTADAKTWRTQAAGQRRPAGAGGAHRGGGVRRRGGARAAAAAGAAVRAGHLEPAQGRPGRA